MATTHRLMTAVLVGACLALMPARPAGQAVPWPTQDETLLTAAVREAIARAVFDRNVGDYAALHRRLAAELPPIQDSRDIDIARGVMRTLAIRIQAARATARQGDVFTPGVVPLFRKQIALKVPPEIAAMILAEQTEDEGAPVPRIEVNMPWPEGVPCAFMPPRLLLALPRLPPELQYQFLGRSLVLWDYHANLIVDVLPGALTT
jgi:hypothetical protein